MYIIIPESLWVAIFNPEKGFCMKVIAVFTLKHDHRKFRWCMFLPGLIDVPQKFSNKGVTGSANNDQGFINNIER